MSYQSKIPNIENGGFSISLPTTQGSGSQFLQTNGAGSTSWSYINGNNPQGGSGKVMVYGRRTRGLINGTQSTLMIDRAGVLIGANLLSGDPAANGLFWSTVTVPAGYDGIWAFNITSWKCGPGGALFRMTVTRAGPTIVFDQGYNYSNIDCGTNETFIMFDGCLAGDQITFTVNDNNGGTNGLISITNASLTNDSGTITGIWYATRELFQISNYLTASPLYYTVGTASQTGTTITGGGGAVWDPSMVGGIIIFHTGNEHAYITGYTDPTTLTTDVSQNISSTGYTIFYNGVQFNSSGLLTSNTLSLQAATNQLLVGPATLNSPAPSGEITVNLPAATTTLVGATEIATLTNKTLTNPTINSTGTITNSCVVMDTNVLDISRTSPAIPLNYFTGRITEIAKSSLVGRTGGVAAGWVVGIGSLQAGASNNGVAWRILVSGPSGGTLTYTLPNNPTPGVYKWTYRIETEGNRAIHQMQVQVDGGAFQTIRIFDAYNAASTGSYTFEDYFVVSTSGNPCNLRLLCDSKNGLSPTFIAGFVTPFTVHRMG